MKTSDRIGLALGYTTSLFGLAVIGSGVALFWGSWKDIASGLVVIAMGCIAYLLGRWQVWGMRREMERRVG